MSAALVVSSNAKSSHDVPAKASADNAKSAKDSKASKVAERQIQSATNFLLELVNKYSFEVVEAALAATGCPSDGNVSVALQKTTIAKCKELAQRAKVGQGAAPSAVAAPKMGVVKNSLVQVVRDPKNKLAVALNKDGTFTITVENGREAVITTVNVKKHVDATGKAWLKLEAHGEVEYTAYSEDFVKMMVELL
jgi:hypothetical protein